VSWVLNSAFVSAVIAGPRTEEQWDDYLRALDYRFTAEDEALIDRLVTSGHLSTPGYNDPAYLIEGRRPRSAGRLRRQQLFQLRKLAVQAVLFPANFVVCGCGIAAGFPEPLALPRDDFGFQLHGLVPSA
jgi:hypothetical protein